MNRVDNLMLSEIEKESAVLNQGADKANEYISEVEKRLSQASVGIAVWIKEPIIKPTVEEECRDNCVRAIWLGYSKESGEWGLTLKYEGRPENEGGQYQLLIKASREIRILSAVHVSSLLNLILLDARQATSRVRDYMAVHGWITMAGQ